MKLVERLSDNKGFVLTCHGTTLAGGETIKDFVEDIFNNQEADNVYTGIACENPLQGLLNEQEHTLFWQLYKEKQEMYDKR